MEGSSGNDDEENNVGVKKGYFKFKNGKNGVILTVHHTICEGPNIVRVRLVTACFGEDNTHFVTIDHRGNIFIFNLASKRFWKLNEKVPKSYIARNILGSIYSYIIGTKDGKVTVVNIKTGEITKTRKFTHHCIENISFPGVTLSPNNFVVHSIQAAFLVNLSTFETTHKLEFNESKISLKFVAFLPRCDKIFSCFTNDSVHIWSGTTLNTIRIIHPIRMRDRFVKNKEVQELSLISTSNSDLDKIFKGIVKDYTRGLLNSFSFSPDCRYICLSTVDDFIIIMSPISYEIVKLIRLKDITCMSTSFLPKTTDLMLFALTSTSDVILIDCNDLLIKAVLQDGKSYKMNTSGNGKMLFIVLKTGEINIYSTSVVVNSLKAVQRGLHVVKESKGLHNIEVGLLDKELKKTLTKDRLIPILTEYGQFPEKYRHLIWSSLLDLPCNKTQFGELAKKGIHPVVADYDQEYPLKDASGLRNLKKTMSSLIHWCSVFAHCDYLPGFIFPFLKIFPNSPMLSFELVVSIILNYCQLWFEFAPMEPLNYLGLVENALGELDCELSQFYAKKNITTKIYAWPLMTTGFSEVLDEHQWYQLWDNILSNQPYYLVFCIIAYNVVQKNVIMKLEAEDSIEQFFHEQNIIDMRRFIRRINLLMERCPDHIHPKRYMKKYMPITKGFYPKFENYPKKWVELKDNEMETLRMERALLDKKIRELEKVEISLAKRLEEGLKQEEYEKRMKEVEKLYGEALTREEERISCQRKMLVLYQKQIRDRKAKVLELVRESAHRRNVNSRENELDTLMRTIEQGRVRDEADMMFADEDIKIRELNLLAQKYQMEAALMDNEPFAKRFKAAIDKLENEKKRLTIELKNLIVEDSHARSTGADVSKKISAIEDMLQQIQIEFIRTIKPESRKSTKESTLEDLEMKTNRLEREVHHLLHKL